MPLRASDVALGSDVHCVSDVSPRGEVGKHHITLRPKGAIHHYGEAITSRRQSRHITPLDTPPLLCYNRLGKVVESMYEVAQMLNIGMVVFFVAIFVSVVLLILIQRNKIIPKQETRIMLGKILSVTPFVFNLGLLIGFLCILVLQFVVSINIIIIALFVILYGSGFSAVMGESVALVGLYFSAGCIKSVEGTGKKYIVFSIISMIISLVFLVIYLFALFPLWMQYYGL